MIGLYSGLLSDADTAAIFSDTRQIALMIEVERALARVEGRLGVIEPAHAAEIDRRLDGFQPDAEALAEGTERTGVPVPALVTALRTEVGGEAAASVHWGATSQDILDTAVVLELREALALFDERLQRIAGSLVSMARMHRLTPVCCRTRAQMAAPTSFGLKAANWAEPLLAARRRLGALRQEVLIVSFGGAVGTLASLEDRGLDVMDALAAELDLGVSDLPWHVRRDGLAALAGWAAGVTLSLGKIALDVIAMSQNEVAELREGGEGRGGSSTMPNKANPVRSEAILTLGRHARSAAGEMQEAMLHAHDRDGVAWQTEWLALPQLMLAAGAALRQAEALVADLIVDPDRMRTNIDATRGTVMAEAATFALARHMPRPDAHKLVSQACRDAVAGDRSLFDLLAERTDAPVDWAALRRPENHLSSAAAMLDRWLDGVVSRQGRD
ncbi:MAG: adenylosuccinate lyase family protein [Minwuia sp.]|uniref:class-II fumarase/aspartase family protein n=1 Tax=Minwuia sp. TaxID=2493630 RepID=UPI003A8C0196